MGQSSIIYTYVGFDIILYRNKALNALKFVLSSNVLFKAVHFCNLCFVIVIVSCLFIAALWSPAGKGLTSWFSCV